jgi:hypothetical protein
MTVNRMTRILDTTPVENLSTGKRKAKKKAKMMIVLNILREILEIKYLYHKNLEVKLRLVTKARRWKISISISQ